MALIRTPNLSSVTLRGRSASGSPIKFTLNKFPVQQIEAALARAVNRASQRITGDLKMALDDAMRSNIWSTLNGIADIVDSGELLSSGTVSASSAGVIVAYSAPYAALVHFGGYINPYGNQSLKVYLPPRPWVEAVLRGLGPIPAFDFQRYYDEEIQREFS